MGEKRRAVDLKHLDSLITISHALSRYRTAFKTALPYFFGTLGKRFFYRYWVPAPHSMVISC